MEETVSYTEDTDDGNSSQEETDIISSYPSSDQEEMEIADDDTSYNFGLFLTCDKTQESKNCSLISQHSRSGRLARRLTLMKKLHSDSVLARAVCRLHE